MSITNIFLFIIILFLAGYCLRLKLRQRPETDHSLTFEGLDLQVSNNDVMQFVRDMSENFRPAMESRNITFDVTCNPESMMGWIDTDIIDKIPLLLLSDMYKGCPDGGKITIQASTNRHYDSVVIRINDNSPQPLGMSLVIARQLASLHHGTVRSEYYEGQGNMVIAELPIKKDVLLKERHVQPVAQESMANNQPSTFHIPSNIQLNIPTIELPEGVTEGNQSLGSLVQQAYNSPDHQFLQKAIKCVHDHIDDSDYDRDAFAADMGASASTLYNKLRALTGKNVTVFIRDIRIQTAIKLAKDNADLRVSDIAYRVGFRDPKYFATTFKKVTGKQPKEYFDEIRRT